MYCHRRNADPLQYRLTRLEQRLSMWLSLLVCQPTESRYDATRKLHRFKPYIKYFIDALGIASPKCQQRCSKNLAGFLPGELLLADLPTGITSDPQTIDVGIEAIVEFHKVFQRVVRRTNGGVSKQPEEGGFLGMLVYHSLNDPHNP
jgi:hypothetical protein